MDIVPVIYLIFLLMLLRGCYLLTFLETLLPTLNPSRLETLAEQKNTHARRALEMIRQPAKYLPRLRTVTLLLIIAAGVVSGSVLAEPMKEGLQKSLAIPDTFVYLYGLCQLILILVHGFLFALFANLLPRRLAQQKPERLKLRVWSFAYALCLLLSPFAWLLERLSNLFLRLMGLDPNHEEEQVSEEEIRMMVDAGSEKGAIDEQEKEFIENVFEFDDLTAGEIATHRTDVTFLWMDDSMEEWAATIHSSRHTRYPVCRESADNVVGTLNAKDYFRLEDKSRENVMALVHPPYYVPRSIKADVLFRNMKKSRSGMAIVLDEYGGMDGIITINDLIEQLVGDLGEETAEAEANVPHIEQQSENVWTLIGNVELYDIEQALDVDIGLEGVDTFTGLVFKELGMVPPDGDHNLDMVLKGLNVHISRIEDHQIMLATVTKPLPQPEEEKE